MSFLASLRPIEFDNLPARSQPVFWTKSPSRSEALLVCGVQVTRRISKEEQRQMEKMVIIRGEKRNVEKLVGRRKYKKTYEYEVKVSAPPLWSVACNMLLFYLCVVGEPCRCVLDSSQIRHRPL